MELRLVAISNNSLKQGILQQYISRAFSYLAQKGYQVLADEKTLGFQAKRIMNPRNWREVLDFVVEMIAVTSLDGDYAANPLTGAYGKGYLRNFVKMKEIGKDDTPTICITDIPLFTTGSQMSVQYGGWVEPNVSWFSVRNPRTDSLLDDATFFEYLEDSIKSFS